MENIEKYKIFRNFAMTKTIKGKWKRIWTTTLTGPRAWRAP